ncbi:Aspartyl/glutamyl-tRNA(Asn/Gln) amidotransferase subunit B [Ephemeroptericola cinctiostellae]|uniref:Aspartyl/glutamyl-tRNA(Asn/Gln) amidotransferase subunit B n=1 Tax=Ephemeroptericola cinctiostellae TaxID=2268024 RepID=A0A345D809_9BURK|nr:Asp-tRNA(Asn)/Glu-tRNA(Gln) amidotransferase subunit GatB [Ephemeroptericola cinctiostellae]AXF84497.1 Aspartyl/glutamyl-tRNA(Asn/Gln) amidotransferase subunit B [Ephemeroptericola cinctiostellae]
MSWEVIIGLETHAQLSTASKIFSGASTTYGAEPNTQSCAVDLALPGVLPVLNKAAVEKAIAFGLAIDAEVAPMSVFARKNYFYPDLPKGYQISQFELPVVIGGTLSFNVGEKDKAYKKTVQLTRAHLEEDAGKSTHELFDKESGIDLNRAGTPLLEIVTEPCIYSAKEAVAYAKALHSLVVWLGMCDGNMQEGSFRCDANVSVRPVGQKELGTRREIKNLNSFKFLEDAINYEINEQIRIIEDGGRIQQATVLFDPNSGVTRVMRTKEDAHDYRYFPDPDLAPLVISDAWRERVRATMPELPAALQARFVSEYALSEYDAEQVSASKAHAEYFETAVKAMTKPDAKMVANWMMSDLAATLNKEEIELSNSPVSALRLAQLIAKIQDSTLSNKLAKEVFAAVWVGEQQAQGDAQIDAIIEARGLKQVSDVGAIEAIIQEIMDKNTQIVEEYRAGKEKGFGFLVGQVMKASKGKANPAQVNELLLAKLKS